MASELAGQRFGNSAHLRLERHGDEPAKRKNEASVFIADVCLSTDLAPKVSGTMRIRGQQQNNQPQPQVTPPLV
jgi:hypothetical protein